MTKRLAIALGLAAALSLAVGCEELKPIGSRGSKAGAVTGSGDKVKLEFYIMSKCPFGVQVAQGIAPVLQEMGDYIDFQMNYIVNEKDGKLTSMHGEPELKGDIIQLCAMKHYPDVKKYMGFIDCWNKNWRAIPQGWEGCADQAGLDKGRIRSCADGKQGEDLLRESMKRAQAANASGSPTIFLAGEAYNGGRGKLDFMRAICEKFPEGKKPNNCNNIPEEPEVAAIVLTDKRCAKCQTAGLENNLKMRFFPKLKVETIDYSEERGKDLYKKLGLKYLPVWLFKKGVEDSAKYGQIQRWMMDKGEYKQLRIPANFDPTAEICDNKKDDTGNGKIDCADPTCVNTLLCRKEIPKKVEVFVMSQCPYGTRALDAMKEVLAALKTINFDVHFIADEAQGTETGFNALHGQPEVRENIRMLCVKKYYKRAYKYMNYIWCRNKNIRSEDWKGCATQNGMDAAKLDRCSTGSEGKKLLADDIKIAKSLEISGSPTWLANNKFKFSGIAPEPVKSNICQHNKGLAGCDKKLTNKSDVPAGGCGK
jgi:predicted DsbA family dithiol-disulfide isomerase